MADEENLNEIRRRKTQRIKAASKRARRTRRILLTVLIFLFLAGAAVGYFCVYKPYASAENTMPQNGTMELHQQEDGTILLNWSSGWNADYYIVELLPIQEAESEAPSPLFSATVEDGESCTLPGLPQDQELTLRVRCAKRYQVLWLDRVRMGTDVLEVSGSFPYPSVENITWNVDPDTEQLDIQYELPHGELLKIRLSRNNGKEDWQQVVDTEAVRYLFGDDEEYPVPVYGDTFKLIFQPYLQKPGLQFYGLESSPITLTREDFLGTVLNMECQDLGHNQYTLTWNETKGEYYEVQAYDGAAEEWVALAQIPANATRSYTTPHLNRYTSYQFRVVAVGGETLPGSDLAAISEEADVTTEASVIFSTIWPIQDLEVYSDTERTEVIGTAPQATAYCILDEVDGLFKIRFDDGCGYIDSNYCMINLPEYIGDLCSYDITNSYSAVYMVHGYEIPEVTGEVVKGYEDIELGDGIYLVPLLYPTAQKLEQAAFAALDQGYRIKIYDSYRPQEASLSVYSYTKEILEEPIPEETYSGEPMEDLPEFPEPEEGEEPFVLTYSYLMTDNDRFYINNFITNTDSQHNLGIAMDMTLVDLSSGEELEMQTAMHDLSHYSALENNNANANKLSSIMRAAGFGGLFSEWWHFQDNNTRNALGLKNYMKIGVSCQCWVADDYGWRYRNEDGNFYANCTMEIDGERYTFDLQGYLLEDSINMPR